MGTSFDHMMKENHPKNPVPARPARAERRNSRRCKITQLMRIRPSDPERPDFDDIRGTLSVSRSGVYFQSSETAYEIGMRLFVSMPYSGEPAAMTREYLAEVVRRDPLPNGLFGIGFKILMEMGLRSNFNVAYPMPRK
jgi:PilZ domain